MTDDEVPPGLDALYAPIHTRAWSRPVKPEPRDGKTKRTPAKRKARAWRGVETAGPVLVFDTETTIDAAQALTFGSWRFGYYSNGGHLLILEEGLFYADDLPQSNAPGLDVLRKFAAGHRADVDRASPSANPVLRLLSRSEFVGTVLFRAIQANAIIVNFNKPFDLTRIATGVGMARGERYGGFSLRIWDNDYSRPRLVLKPRDSKSAFAELTGAKKLPLKPGNIGRFLDLRTLGFALDAKSYTLSAACTKWDVEHPKQTATEHGVITDEYIGYNLADTRATAELCARMFADLEQHPIEARPERMMSSATIAKRYLRAMGVRPRLEIQPDFPNWLLGAAMSTFYGGRAECKIRRTPMPVEVHDFTSMYPTINALMGLWSLHTAARIDYVDATDDVRAFLEGVTLDAMFDRTNWPKVVAIVELDADQDVLPVRARYGQNGDDAATIGINPYTSDGPQWFTLPDVVASLLLTGTVPTIRRAIRFEGHGRLRGLKPTMLGGTVPIDPRTEDFFTKVIEERVPVKTQPIGAFLKVLANSGSYGIFAQTNRHDLAPDAQQDVNIYPGSLGSDGAMSSEFTIRTAHPEEPGDYCFPPIATAITGGARLMLAMLERCVTDAGGTWVYGDTDSMAIVATEHGGPIDCAGETALALSFEQTDAIRRRFGDDLNPYDRTRVPELLKSEYRGLCYAISAKRYGCYTLAGDGRVIVDREKVSEHGLGHLLDPTLGDALHHDGEAGPVPEWIRQAWELMIASAIGAAPGIPDWLGRPAVGRFTVTSTGLLQAFDRHNNGKAWADQVKPANFLLSIGIRGDAEDHGRLVAPFERDPTRWSKIAWYLPRDGANSPRKISTNQIGGYPALPVETYDYVLQRHLRHPESKFAASDGNPCSADTIGPLQRRPVQATGREVIGNESDHLEEVQAGLLLFDPTRVFRSTAHPWREIVEALRRASVTPRYLAAVLPGRPLSLRQTRRILSAYARPRDQSLRRAVEVLASNAAYGGRDRT